MPILPFSLPRFADHPFLYSSLLASLCTVLLFGLLVLRRSIRRRVAKLSPVALTTAGESSGEAPPLGDTKSFPALIELVCPISGKPIEPHALDFFLSEKALGCQCAILPSEGKLYAPCDCEIAALSDDRRALTLLSAEGARLTLSLECSDMTVDCEISPYCKMGDSVKQGDLLLAFDLDALDSADLGYAVAIVLEDADRYDAVTLSEAKKLSVGEHWMTLTPKGIEDGSLQ